MVQPETRPRPNHTRGKTGYVGPTLFLIPGLSFLPEAAFGRSTCWLTCLQVDADAFGASPEEIRLRLEEQNIEARPVWKPMHLQPVFAGKRVRGGQVAAEVFARGLCLPSGSSRPTARE